MSIVAVQSSLSRLSHGGADRPQTTTKGATSRFEFALEDAVVARRREDEQQRRDGEQDTGAPPSLSSSPASSPAPSTTTPSSGLSAPVHDWLNSGGAPRGGDTAWSTGSPAPASSFVSSPSSPSSSSSSSPSSSSSSSMTTMAPATTLAEALDQALRRGDDAEPGARDPATTKARHRSLRAASNADEGTAKGWSHSELALSLSSSSLSASASAKLATTASADVVGVGGVADAVDSAHMHAVRGVNDRTGLVDDAVDSAVDSDVGDDVGGDDVDDADDVGGGSIDGALMSSLGQRGSGAAAAGLVSAPAGRHVVAGLERLEDLLHDPATGIFMDGRAAVVTVGGVTVRLVTDADGHTSVSMAVGDDAISGALLSGQGALGGALEKAGLKLEQLVVNGGDVGAEPSSSGQERRRHAQEREGDEAERRPRAPSSSTLPATASTTPSPSSSSSPSSSTSSRTPGAWRVRA